MTREQCQALLPIMQAFAEGKEIQYRNSDVDSWINDSDPFWGNSGQWRIKPEPLEIEVWVTPDGRLGRIVYEAGVTPYSNWIKKKFREVTE